jgi:hypothetical protein
MAMIDDNMDDGWQMADDGLQTVTILLPSAIHHLTSILQNVKIPLTAARI